MRLTIGDPAPSFTLRNLDGSSRGLDDCRGEPVWLAIFRFSACPFCLRRVHRLGLEAERISALPLRRLAIFPSPPELLRKYTARFPLPFDVLTDPGEIVTRRYGAETSLLGTLKSLRRPSHTLEGIRSVPSWSPLDGGGSKFRLPADFLLDSDHRVRVAYYGEEADDGIPLERVIDFVEDLRQRDD